jgi:hypothetical protein
MESKELQELNSILLQQIAALKELIAIKDQIIAAKSLTIQPMTIYQPAIQSVPFVQTTPLPWSPQPYQPTITCETPLPSTGQGGAGGATGYSQGGTLGVISVTGSIPGSTDITTLYGGCLVMDSHGIKLATNNVRKII